MALTNQDFSLYAGDTRNIVVTVTNSDGTPANLTGATIKWVAARGKLVMISKDTIDNGIVITDALNGAYTIRLNQSDSSDLAGNLTHESVVTDAFGNITTILTGKMSILPSII